MTGFPSADLGEATPFSFDALQRRAELLAKEPFARPPRVGAQVISQIDYDAYQRIKYRNDRTIRLGANGEYPVQLFHLGKQAPDPVQFSIVSDRHSQDLLYRREFFEIPDDNPATRLPPGIGFAGARIMNSDLKSDWFSMIGASYFRSSSPFNQYGLSARGVAVNTACGVPEEFPRFSHVWLENPKQAADPLVLYALLEGLSVTGAYKMEVRRTTNKIGLFNTEMTIAANLHLRRDVERIGIAPFSSMFWYGEANVQQPRDWRPEIHDSDGLALWTGAGERIWRPLRNPPYVTTNAFLDKNPRGFGLLQRDRRFDHYLDDGVFYDKRPSVWVEPIGNWEDGAVHLVEMPTGEETWDNVVAYWCPSSFRRAGQQRSFSYKLTWCDDIEFPKTLARTIGTWIGIGGPPGLSYKERDPRKTKIVIDFEGGCFGEYDRSAGVELVVDSSRGTVTDRANYPVVGAPLRWRALFDLEAKGIDAVDLRAYLRLGDQALTETWIYQLNPLTT